MVITGMPDFCNVDTVSADVSLLETLQGTPIPTFVIDTGHVIRHWNAACEQTTGFAAGVMIGTRRQWEPFYPTERPVMADLILEGASEEEINSHYGGHWLRSPLIVGAYEAEDYYPEMGAGGTWLYFTAAPLRDAKGNTIGVIETLQDITERKQAEEELRHYHERLEEQVRERTAELTTVNQQLREEIEAHHEAQDELQRAKAKLADEEAMLKAAKEELSQYIFVVSHDLRAPLRAIRNYTDFLLEELGQLLNEEQGQYFSGLKRALNHGEELVRNLLDFSRIGRKEVVAERIDTGRFLRELLLLFPVQAGTEIVMGDDWPTVAAEPTLLEQIFHNLIQNALKFNTSSSRRVELGWQPAGPGKCELYVRDNGIGIDPCHHEQVFLMFQRLHARKEFDGTGIGLAIVRKAAAKLNGSVRLESKRGEGCSVFVTLPLWGCKE